MTTATMPDKCPHGCGAPLEDKHPYLPSYGRYGCGSRGRRDTQTILCVRRQNAALWERLEAAEGLLQRATDVPQAMQQIMKDNGLAIDDLGDPMQKLAFTFYTELVQQAELARRLLEVSGGG